MADRLRTGLDWEDVRFFVALARYGSLSAVARAFAVNHATVSRRVKNFEQALGRKLFERRPDGYELTHAGRETLEAAGQMEAAAGALALQGPPSKHTGLVRITTTPTLSEAFLISHFGSFRSTHPNLDIEINSDLRALSLSRRAADVALRLNRPAAGDLLARKLASIGFGFYGAEKFLQRSVRTSEIPLIGFDDINRDLPEAKWLTRNFPGNRLVFRANTQMAQAAAARAGYGVVLLPHFFGAVSSGLVPIPLRATPPDRELWMLTRRDAKMSSPVSAVTEFLTALFHGKRQFFGDGRTG